MTKPEDDEQFYRDTESIAFPKLDDRQLALLEPLGTRRIVRRGEVVFKAGQRDLGLPSSCAASWKSSNRATGRSKSWPHRGPRDFIGDVAMLMGTAALASARGKAEESEILEVPAPASAGAGGIARGQRADRARLHHAAQAAAAGPGICRAAHLWRRTGRGKAGSSTIFSTRTTSRTG